MKLSRPHGILLAAGAGSRFGGGKLTHVLEGVAIGVRSARNMLAAGLSVTAVIRPGSEALGQLLEAEGCVVTECANAVDGMGFSLSHAVANTVSRSLEAAGWVVALADMPRIAPGTIDVVAKQIEAGALLAAPTYRGERGHPVGLNVRLLNELLALTGDQGAREVVKRHHTDMMLIPIDDPGVIFDIDRREDIAT